MERVKGFNPIFFNVRFVTLLKKVNRAYSYASLWYENILSLTRSLARSIIVKSMTLNFNQDIENWLLMLHIIKK